MAVPLASTSMIRNPVLKGFNPDPSILRVADLDLRVVPRCADPPLA
jgi:hypothetical protein